MQVPSTCKRPREGATIAGCRTARPRRSIRDREVGKILCPLAPLALVVVAISVQYSAADVWVSSIFYNTEMGEWPLRGHWIVKAILHDRAQLAVKLFGVGFILLIAAKLIHSKGRRFPKSLGVTFLAMAIGPLIVGYLKSITHLACPWDESIFGGALPHLRLFDAVPNGTPVGHGFPSAHASSGYAFIAMYFAALVFAPRLRFKALAVGMGLGITFGIAQQARGAHFLSHDLVALSICWGAAGAVFAIFYPMPLLVSLGYRKNIK